MPYTTLLNKLIDESGLTVKEIAERCTQDGVKVTPAYISTLRNDENNRTASDTMSKAIAKACGSKNEDVLVIEAYIDNAPQAFKGIFDFIKESMMTVLLGMFANSYSDDEISTARKLIEQMPLAEMVTQMSQSESKIAKAVGTMNITAEVTDNELKTTTQLKQAIGFDVKDNSMFPTIPKGGKVTLEMLEEYNDGDILAFLDNDKNITYRKAGFLNKEHTMVAMFPLSSDFDSKIYNTDEITILGKVTQVIIDLK